MFYYFFFFGLLAFFALIKINSRIVLYSLLSFLCFFLCFGYMTGSDWRYYELDYVNVTTTAFADQVNELGYYCYNYLFAICNIDFWPFFIFTKIILFILNSYFLIKFSGKGVYFALLSFYSLMAVFEFIDNPMRNLIAGTIFMYGFKYVLERRLLAFTIICIIASLFHKSIIVLWPFYFLLNKEFSKKKLLYSYIIFNVILLLSSEYLITFFRAIDYYNYVSSDKAGEQVGAYLLNENIHDSPFSVGVVSRYILFAVIIFMSDSIKNSSKYGTIIFNSSVIALFMLRFATIWPIAMRFAIPFIVCYCSALSLIIINLKAPKKIIYVTCYLFILAGTLFAQITTSYKYIPYTNYVFYLFAKKPSYDDRFNYNINNSPYRDK